MTETTTTGTTSTMFEFSPTGTPIDQDMLARLATLTGSNVVLNAYAGSRFDGSGLGDEPTVDGAVIAKCCDYLVYDANDRAREVGVPNGVPWIDDFGRELFTETDKLTDDQRLRAMLFAATEYALLVNRLDEVRNTFAALSYTAPRSTTTTEGNAR